MERRRIWGAGVLRIISPAEKEAREERKFLLPNRLRRAREILSRLVLQRERAALECWVNFDLWQARDEWGEIVEELEPASGSSTESL